MRDIQPDGALMIEGEKGLDDFGVGEYCGLARCDRQNGCPRGGGGLRHTHLGSRSEIRIFKISMLAKLFRNILFPLTPEPALSGTLQRSVLHRLLRWANRRIHTAPLSDSQPLR